MSGHERPLQGNAGLRHFSFIGPTPEKGPSLELFDELIAETPPHGADAGVATEIRRFLTERDRLPYAWTPQEIHWLERHPRAKWLEYLIYRYRFKVFPEKRILADFPVYLLIEPTSVCNLRCVMCFQVDRSFTGRPYMGTMKLEDFKRLVDEAVAGGTKALTLASRGEPTLNKQLGEMLRYAAGKFLELKVITNATRLTETLTREILEAGVDLLVFSVDAHEKDLYESIRQRGEFEEVRDNIFRLHEIRRKEFPESSTTTRVSGVKVREEQDPDAFAAFWSRAADEVGMKAAYERWDTYANDPLPEFTQPCEFLWERMYVWFDGKANPCDADYKSLLSPGNVFESSIREVWTSSAFETLRADHLAGKRGEHEPCDRCGIA